MRPNEVDRRALLRLGAAGAGSLALGGCSPDATVAASARQTAADLTYRVQRWLLRADDLAREYTAADITQAFRANGTTAPEDKAYKAHVAKGFTDWRLTIDGLVDRPARLSLAELRALPARTQITRHDCVEGWSVIGQWTGTPLGPILDTAGIKPAARYAVIHCADIMDGGEGAATLSGDVVRYYGSIDLADAHHPQTIIAYELNGKALPVENGAPLRLRVERQLGYKMPKYVERIELVDSFASIGGGRGGYWEDLGYDWYAGI